MADEGSHLLEELMRFRPDGMTPNAWAVRAGVGRTIWSDIRRHGNPSRRTLEKLLLAAGSSLAEFEALRVGVQAASLDPASALADRGREWRQAPPSVLPQFQTANAGAWQDNRQLIPLMSIERKTVIDRLVRPFSLGPDREAYAVRIVSDSMWPRFRRGRAIAVSPSSPVDVGDDVLVLMTSGNYALIGELRSRGANGIDLQQFNPLAEFRVPAVEIEAVHKVMGELI